LAAEEDEAAKSSCTAWAASWPACWIMVNIRTSSSRLNGSPVSAQRPASSM
jgi:hypothetical protein